MPQILIILIKLILTQGLFANDNKQQIKTTSFRNYKELQSEVLDLIGGTQKYLLVATEQLHDSDISAALFLAGYRGVNVKVILSKQYANNFQSRYFFLKNQKVPVALVDDRVFRKPNMKSFVVSKDYVFAFSCQFSHIINCKQPIKYKLATNIDDSWFKKHFDSKDLQPVKPSWQDSIEDKGYVYNNKRIEKPKDVPTALPKQTIWQKKQIIRN